MELEPEEPPHRAFPSCGYALEDLMDVYTLVPADTQRRAVNKAYACTFAQKHFLYEEGKRDGNRLLQLYETVVGNNFWKQVPHVTADMLNIEMLHAAVAGVVEKYHYQHHFSVGKSACTVISAFFTVVNGMFFHINVKKLAEFICHKENFCNFVFGEHCGDCL